jgi:outer membrane protein OmpA-like peptidoglycan-associated protein
MFIRLSFFTYPIINAKPKSMKRITLLLLSFTIVAVTAFAQNRMSGGLSLGVNNSKVSSGGEGVEWKWKFGPVGGLWLDFPIGSSVSIQPSLLYSKMGTKYNFTDVVTNTTSRITQDLGYLSLPVLLKIKAGDAIGILLGPQVDFLVGAHMKDENDNKTKNENDFKQTDFALSGGLQLMPNSPVNLTVRYIHGLADIREATSNSTTLTGAWHNRAVQATLNFRLFGGPKKAVAITTPEPPVVVEEKPPVVVEPAKPDPCALDADKDGVMDCNDKCIDVVGVARYNGCPIPDTDNDGVNDEEDNCPSLPGPVSNHGCPLVDQSTQTKIDMMTKSITWTPSRGYTLTTTANKSLDQIANMLTADANLKVAVNAYTDNVGADADNKTLSQNRADAIKTYLVSKGVKESQITATGFGEEQPIADNGTSAGRAKNNRVEIKLSY